MAKLKLRYELEYDVDDNWNKGIRNITTDKAISMQKNIIDNIFRWLFEKFKSTLKIEITNEVTSDGLQIEPFR